MATGFKTTAFPLDLVGPAGGQAVTCKFSVVGSTLTTLEAMGCTVARTGTGTYVVTLGRAFKNITYSLTVRTAAGAATQSVWVTGETASTITITQFTSGTSTPVDTLTFTANLIIVGRANS